jgi:hypothetical protein
VPELTAHIPLRSDPDRFLHHEPAPERGCGVVARTDTSDTDVAPSAGDRPDRVTAREVLQVPCGGLDLRNRRMIPPGVQGGNHAGVGGKCVDVGLGACGGLMARMEFDDGLGPTGKRACGIVGDGHDRPAMATTGQQVEQIDDFGAVSRLRRNPQQRSGSDQFRVVQQSGRRDPPRRSTGGDEPTPGWQRRVVRCPKIGKNYTVVLIQMDA